MAYNGWIWPVELHPQTRAKPVISDGFDRDSRGGVGHFGVDIMYRRLNSGNPRLPQFTKMFEMPDGVKILSCGPGTVRRINPNDSHGMVIEIDHLGFSGVGPRVSAYRHLSSVIVQVGQSVQPGQQIGVVGYDRTRKPTETPNHLHFELWDTSGKFTNFTEKRKKYGIDPAPFMKTWGMLSRDGTKRQPTGGEVSGPFESTPEDVVTDDELLAEIQNANFGELLIAGGAAFVLLS